MMRTRLKTDAPVALRWQPRALVGLAWMDGGSRSLYTKKPVRKPEDLKGQKIP